VHDLAEVNLELDQAVALLSLLDFYVGVSNTNMHLLAGLGKHADVLIPAPPDWRWMLSGDHSPWFPGFRAYRQTVDLSWETAVRSLRERLLAKAHQ
jgi:hypothetical protein